MPGLRGRRAHAAIGAALLAVVAVGGVGRGSAAPQPQADPPPDQICSVVPALPCASSATVTGAIGISTTVRSDRTRMVIDLAGLYSVGYLQPKYRAAFGTIPAPKEFAPIHPKPGCTYVAGDVPVDSYAVSSPSGAPFDPDRTRETTALAVGQFPPTRVSLLAFGAIPVTAVLHASQPLRRAGDHYTGPLLVHEYTTFGSRPSGCDPAWEAQMPPLWATVRGPINLRISDIKVDGQAVDAGPACRSVQPAQLNLWGDPKYVPLLGGKLFQQQDETMVTTKDGSAAQYRLHPGSTNLTVPAFTGCVGRDGEDISRLITAMVSGDDNTVAVQQSFLAFDPSTPDGPKIGFYPKYPLSCSASQHKCPDPPGNLDPPPVGH